MDVRRGIRTGFCWLFLSIAGCGILAQTPLPKVGDAPPEIAAEKWLSGPGASEASWKALTGKAVVLEFWAAWCGPCVAAIPHMNDLADKFKDKPLRFIAVTDDKETRVQALLERRPMKAWVGLDTDDSMFKAYGVRSIPHTVLVDPKGKIAAVIHPALITEQILEDLIAGKSLNVAQAPQPGEQPEPLFEISITPAEGLSGYSTGAGPGLVAFQGVDLTFPFGAAYGLRHTRVSGEGVLPKGKYSILAKIPENHQEVLQPMLRQALEATFSITGQKENRTLDTYVLTAPSGLAKSLKKHEGGSPGTRTTEGAQSVRGSDLEALSLELEEALGKPVLNETRLEGLYDWDLTWDNKKPDSLLASVRDQLGLELSPKKQAVEILVLKKAESPEKKR